MRYRLAVAAGVMLLLFAGSHEAWGQSARRHHSHVRKEQVKTSETDEGPVRKSQKAAPRTDGVATHTQVLGTLDTRYLFGVATSYADSVTMVTMTAQIDSMAYDKGTGAPLGIDLYTKSFRNFLEGQGRTGYICATFVCKTEKEAERKLAAICKKVKKKGQTRLVSADGFMYHYIDTKHIYTNAGEIDKSE